MTLSDHTSLTEPCLGSRIPNSIFNATIPVTLRTVIERLGVKNSVASFTVSFGVTINMDSTVVMQGVATVFIANIYNDPEAGNMSELHTEKVKPEAVF